MSIHTIGDSHSHNGWSGIINHHLGPLLCYSFGKEQLNRCNINNFSIKDGDTVIFCLGEIDCRCHIHKHINKINTYQDIINNIIDNYFEAIKLNIINLQIKLKNICVYNVVPPVQKYNTIENLEYPYLGSDEERKNLKDLKGSEVLVELGARWKNLKNNDNKKVKVYEEMAQKDKARLNGDSENKESVELEEEVDDEIIPEPEPEPEPVKKEVVKKARAKTSKK